MILVDFLPLYFIFNSNFVNDLAHTIHHLAIMSGCNEYASIKVRVKLAMPVTFIKPNINHIE